MQYKNTITLNFQFIFVNKTYKWKSQTVCFKENKFYIQYLVLT